MNVFTHIILASHFTPRFESELDVNIKKINFFYGNIRPDIKIETTMRNHTKEAYTEYAYNLINKIYGEIDEGINYNKFLRDLGAILHFICDFFCYPHNGIYRGTIPQHHLYEFHQMVYIGKYIKKIKSMPSYKCLQSEMSTEDLISSIEKLHKEYIEDNKLSEYERDMVYSIRACLMVGNIILNQYVNKYKLQTLQVENY
ncbi:MAG: zinc dependent phospholipase C family protein [Clostridium argentinense]|uniref:zinc dependent phospholipase C family protein n=1 Tax=Clostridium butanoliproducens TaxID=2991837 RepID=UPI001DBA9996|nr:zinc dependent phospholipase C family protein [Clostridium butanoliproducens]MBS5824874.1 zinc dependent phospholipase C family protein [Clostridium argentinense]MDU1347761.1 zinc dependent phospholipase C family protein [Clostridium argentinense]